MTEAELEAMAARAELQHPEWGSDVRALIAEVRRRSAKIAELEAERERFAKRELEWMTGLLQVGRERENWIAELEEEVARLQAILPCEECGCGHGMHALTCSKGGRTGE